MLLIFIFMFGLINVHALDFVVDSIDIKEKSDAVVVKDISIDNLNINSNIVFNDVGDYVKFVIKLKEDDNEEYNIESITDNNDNEFIKTSYTNDNGLIYMTMRYEKEPEEQLSLNDIKINVLYDGDSNSDSEKIINPKTFDSNSYIMLILILIALIGLIVSFKLRNKYMSIVAILFIFIPTILLAEQSFEINIIVKSENIKVIGIKENYTNSISYSNRQKDESISPGDEVVINSEHFYVLDSNQEKTTLLSKYNLLVGIAFDWNDAVFNYLKTFSEDDKGYLLQSRTTNSYIDLNTRLGKITGAVPFAGVNYWDNRPCPPDGHGEVACVDGSSELKDEYAINGATYEGSPYPYVYDSTKSSIGPEFTCLTWGEKGCYANNNGYTIAYYVESYLSKLKRDMRLPNTASARLLSYEEAIALKNIVFGYDVDVEKCMVSGKEFAMTMYGFDEETSEEAVKAICVGSSLEGVTLRGMINAGEISSEYYEALGITNVIDFSKEIKDYEFWLGSAKDSTLIWSSSSIDEEYGYSYDRSKVPGVRPVIVVNTSDLL